VPPASDPSDATARDACVLTRDARVHVSKRVHDNRRLNVNEIKRYL